MLLNLSVADFLSATVGGTISTMANAAGKFYLGRVWCLTGAFLVGTFGKYKYFQGGRNGCINPTRINL